MKPVHGLVVVLVLVAVYLAGVKFPSFGQSILAKVGM